MVQGGQIRKKYPSDLTDEQWAIVGDGKELCKIPDENPNRWIFN